MTNTAAEVRRHGERARKWVTWLWAGSLVLVVLERFSAAAIRLVQTGFADEPLRAFACQLVAAVPEGLFLLGLWWVRETLVAFGGGALFAAPIARMLERVGIVLALGSAVRIFVVPGVCRLLGFNAGYWIAFDAASLVLGSIGLAFHAIASVLRHASAVQSELDEIF